jgi:hypothetical protein
MGIARTFEMDAVGGESPSALAFFRPLGIVKATIAEVGTIPHTSSLRMSFSLVLGDEAPVAFDAGEPARQKR